MENSDIDVLIGMLEDGIDAGYDEYDDITYYDFKEEYDEPSSEIKNLLDKIGVKYRLDTEAFGFKVRKMHQTLIIDYGEVQKIKDWLKSNKKQLMEYIKTKDKKTIGKFALIFGEALDENLLKEIINSYNTDEFGLNYVQRGKILSYIKDPIYLKYVLRNSSSLNVTIDNFVYTHIIKSINDVNQIKDYIEKANAYDKYGIAELVISLNEPEYTKKIIENREKYGLDGYDVMKLLQSFNDTEFIKQIMKNRKQYDLKTEDIVKLIKNLNDSEYVKQVIENWKQYDIDGYSIVELLKYINDPEYIKQVMENEEKYGVNGDNIVELLKSLNDLKYTNSLTLTKKNKRA